MRMPCRVRRRFLWLAAAVATAAWSSLAAAGFGPAKAAKPAVRSVPERKKRGGFGAGLVNRKEEEKRRQQRLGKDPSVNKDRELLLSQTSQQMFRVGDLDIPLAVPSYVLDYKMFERMVEAGAGTVSDIVWPAEQALADTLLARRDLWRDRLCELGAGLGLAGITAAKAGIAKKVLLTDRDGLVLGIAKKSAAANGVADAVSTAAFDWADKDQWPSSSGVLTIAADVLYDKSVVPALVELILHLDGPALLIEPDNIERRSLGSVDYFKEMMTERGMQIEVETYFNRQSSSSPMLILTVSPV
ncbi:unnamed protein product [Effrenium voratum]|nr:unnamed protein product [Effrenium voratum]